MDDPFLYWRVGFNLISCVCVLVGQSCLTLCDPVDYSLPGSSVHGILQTRIPKWVAMPSSRGSSWPRDRTCISCITGGFFTAEPPGKPLRGSEVGLTLPHFSAYWSHSFCLDQRICQELGQKLTGLHIRRWVLQPCLWPRAMPWGVTPFPQGDWVVPSVGTFAGPLQR